MMTFTNVAFVLGQSLQALSQASLTLSGRSSWLPCLAAKGVPRTCLIGGVSDLKSVSVGKLELLATPSNASKSKALPSSFAFPLVFGLAFPFASFALAFPCADVAFGFSLRFLCLGFALCFGFALALPLALGSY